MDYTGSIYRLIDRAEDEMKEYACPKEKESQHR